MFDQSDTEGGPISPLWRLAPELRIVQAPLLLAGREPQGLDHAVERSSDRPRDYDAARDAIAAAVFNRAVEGRIRPRFEFVPPSRLDDGGYERDIPGTIDPETSFVDVEGLVEWLRSRGFTSGYFFPDGDDRPQYLDPAHARFAPKLAAAVEAWQAYDESSSEAGRPKQRLKKWLRLNAPRFGLTGDDGKPTETAIEEIAKVANWDRSGGAPKSSAGESDVD